MPGFGQQDLMRLQVQRVIARHLDLALAIRGLLAHLQRQQARHVVDLVVQIGVIFGLAGNDQRGARFIDQDRIDFIDDRKIQCPLDPVARLEHHVVAQVIEAEFIVGAVGDVCGVLLAALLRSLAGQDDACRHAERAEDAARRARSVAGTGALSERAILDAELIAREARARSDLAAAQLERATLRSPIEGTVLQVSVRAGEFVTAGGKPAIVVGDISRLQIRCDIDEQMAPRMRENLPARGYLKGEGNREDAEARAIPLRFIRIDPFVIPKASLTGVSTERVDTRVLQVIYQFDRPADRPIFVGQQMDVYIDTSPDAK